MIKLAILVVTGASGAGKTAAVRRLEARGRPGVRCFYFDSIAVPSEEVMKRDFGGGEGWQADATNRWISRLATETRSGDVSILDGQTRPSFVRAALAESTRIAARVVLFECGQAVRMLGCRSRRWSATASAGATSKCWMDRRRDRTIRGGGAALKGRAGAFHPEAVSFRIETGALGSGWNLPASGGWHAI
jgi:hypothetical protein